MSIPNDSWLPSPEEPLFILAMEPSKVLHQDARLGVAGAPSQIGLSGNARPGRPRTAPQRGTFRRSPRAPPVDFVQYAREASRRASFASRARRHSRPEVIGNLKARRERLWGDGDLDLPRCACCQSLQAAGTGRR